MFVERLFQFTFWSALVFALVMASLPQPPAVPGNPSDKVLHLLAFLVLSCLATFAFPRIHLSVLLVGLAVFGGAIEVVQAIPALGREASWHDWIADVAASGVGLIGAGAIRYWMRRQPEVG